MLYPSAWLSDRGNTSLPQNVASNLGPQLGERTKLSKTRCLGRGYTTATVKTKGCTVDAKIGQTKREGDNLLFLARKTTRDCLLSVVVLVSKLPQLNMPWIQYSTWLLALLISIAPRLPRKAINSR